MRVLTAGLLAGAISLLPGVVFADQSNGVPLRADAADDDRASGGNSDPALLSSNSASSSGNSGGGYFDTWFSRVADAQSSQPHWMTPLATVTPRLEEEFRYDQYWEQAGNGSSLQTLDSGKGLELIPTTTNEVLINLPAYDERTVKKPVDGWADWPVLTIKQRLLSSPEDQGNYILSAFLGVQAPTGSIAFTNRAWVITPTLAGGFGFGDFDVQGTFGVPIPLEYGSTIGTSGVSNLALQYHLAKYFWPEVEFNDTDWFNGERGGKNQLLMTTGVILGRFDFIGRSRFIVGAGYQFALEPSPAELKPALVPTYNHAWLMSVRTAF